MYWTWQIEAPVLAPARELLPLPLRMRQNSRAVSRQAGVVVNWRVARLVGSVGFSICLVLFVAFSSSKPISNTPTGVPLLDDPWYARDRHCPKCYQQMNRDAIGLVYMTDPPQVDYECPRCGHVWSYEPGRDTKPFLYYRPGP